MRRLLAVASLIIAIVPGALAQASRAELDRLTAQLAQKPADAALRDRAIALALSLSPPPAVPETAREFFVRGNTALQAAKGPADYDRAIGHYANALRIAPWFGDAYFNQAKAYELRARYPEAIAALGWYLKAAPGAADARAAQDKIYELKEKQEAAKRTPSRPPAAAATRPAATSKPAAQPPARTIEGTWQWGASQTTITRNGGTYTFSGVVHAVVSSGENHFVLRVDAGLLQVFMNCRLSGDGMSIQCPSQNVRIDTGERSEGPHTTLTRIR